MPSLALATGSAVLESWTSRTARNDQSAAVSWLDNRRVRVRQKSPDGWRPNLASRVERCAHGESLDFLPDASSALPSFDSRHSQKGKFYSARASENLPNVTGEPRRRLARLVALHEA